MGSSLFFFFDSPSRRRFFASAILGVISVGFFLLSCGAVIWMAVRVGFGLSEREGRRVHVAHVYEEKASFSTGGLAHLACVGSVHTEHVSSGFAVDEPDVDSWQAMHSLFDVFGVSEAEVLARSDTDEASWDSSEPEDDDLSVEVPGLLGRAGDETSRRFGAPECTAGGGPTRFGGGRLPEDPDEPAAPPPLLSVPPTSSPASHISVTPAAALRALICLLISFISASASATGTDEPMSTARRAYSALPRKLASAGEITIVG